MNQDTNNFNQQGNSQMSNHQNQDMEQNINVNQQQTANPMPNNNMYQQPVNQNNISNVNSTNNSSKQNKIKIIGIAAVVVVILFVCIILFGGGSSSNKGGYTVDYGNTLEVNEIDGYYNFDINVLSIEKNHPISSYFYDGDCYALKVNIKNNSSSELNLLSLIDFTLIDSSNNEVESLNMIASSMIEGSIKDEISSGKSETGYFYFYNIDDKGYASNIDDSDISKLKISVPKELVKSGDVIKGNYYYYYINLK